MTQAGDTRETNDRTFSHGRDGESESGANASGLSGLVQRHGGALQVAVALQHLMTQSFLGFVAHVILMLVIEHQRDIGRVGTQLLRRLLRSRRIALKVATRVLAVAVVFLMVFSPPPPAQKIVAAAGPEPGGPKAELMTGIRIFEIYRSVVGVFVRGRVESVHEECRRGRTLVVRGGATRQALGSTPTNSVGEWSFYHDDPYIDLVFSVPRWPVTVRDVGPANCIWNRERVDGLPRPQESSLTVRNLKRLDEPPVPPWTPEPAQPDEVSPPAPVPPAPEPARPDPD